MKRPTPQCRSRISSEGIARLQPRLISLCVCPPDSAPWGAGLPRVISSLVHITHICKVRAPAMARGHRARTACWVLMRVLGTPVGSPLQRHAEAAPSEPRSGSEKPGFREEGDVAAGHGRRGAGPRPELRRAGHGLRDPWARFLEPNENYRQTSQGKKKQTNLSLKTKFNSGAAFWASARRAAARACPLPPDAPAPTVCPVTAATVPRMFIFECAQDALNGVHSKPLRCLSVGTC